MPLSPPKGVINKPVHVASECLNGLPSEILLTIFQDFTAPELARLLKVSQRLRAVILAHEAHLAREIAAVHRDRLRDDAQKLDFSGIEIAVALQRYLQCTRHSYCRETEWVRPLWAPSFAELYASKQPRPGVSGSVALNDPHDIGKLVHYLFVMQRWQEPKDPMFQLPMNYGLSFDYPTFAATVTHHWHQTVWSENELRRTYDMLSEGEVFGKGYRQRGSNGPHVHINSAKWAVCGHRFFHKALVGNGVMDITTLLPAGSSWKLFCRHPNTRLLRRFILGLDENASLRPLVVAALFEHAEICDPVSSG
ncbi:hypothetical protein LTR36_005028 [Oleoguttula mirabilis]|uniref:F-box domain-containing protein n=1 Tax=Oleoguttula mirabilis TaxID=1507867 RepID=A0AAV9JW33_9PEZI|nr:hypothetical protein LTR36_005028 [Oleoguttula mirabilis]